tara:strand:- start:105 stop:497 length:393 start_codon:yes stop_codon:yes gene_type:complete
MAYIQKSKGSTFKMMGSSPVKIDLTKKKTPPMVGAPGGDPNFKIGLKKLKNTKKNLVHKRNTGPLSPSTPFTPPPAGGDKSKGTLKGITNFEYDFPIVNKGIELHQKAVKKVLNTYKKGGQKIYDYFTKK